MKHIETFYENVLMFVNYLEEQADKIENKIIFYKQQKNEHIFSDDISRSIQNLKDSCRILKKKLSHLACDLTQDDENLTQVLDYPYLNQKLLFKLSDEIEFSKNTFIDKNNS